MMTRGFAAALFCVIAVSVGCDRAKEAAEVRKNVSAAQQEANKQVTDARQAAAVQTAKAQRDVSTARQEADERVTDANRGVAMARIDGEHKVAGERCLALSGEAQVSCKADADAAFELAKRRVDNTFKE